MNPLCRDLGVGLIPWSPLARGMLTGTRSRGGGRHTLRAQTDQFGDTLYSDADFAVVDAVGAIAADRGVPAAQVALAWLLHQPGVTAPIFGATKPGHVDDAVAAVSLELTEDDRKRLESPYEPHTVSGHS